MLNSPLSGQGGASSSSSKQQEDYPVLFAQLIARTAKDIDVLIDSLPSEDSSPELQVSSVIHCWNWRSLGRASLWWVIFFSRLWCWFVCLSYLTPYTPSSTLALCRWRLSGDWRWRIKKRQSDWRKPSPKEKRSWRRFKLSCQKSPIRSLKPWGCSISERWREQGVVVEEEEVLGVLEVEIGHYPPRGRWRLMKLWDDLIENAATVDKWLRIHYGFHKSSFIPTLSPYSLFFPHCPPWKKTNVLIFILFISRSCQGNFLPLVIKLSELWFS